VTRAYERVANAFLSRAPFGAERSVEEFFASATEGYFIVFSAVAHKIVAPFNAFAREKISHSADGFFFL